MNTSSILGFRQSFAPALTTVIATVAVGVSVGLAPEPAGISRHWQLQVEFSPLRVWSGDVGDGSGARAYFYMTYKAVNRTGKDVVFAPSFELLDGDGRITKSGTGVPSDVTKALINRSNGTLLEDQISIIGTMMQGEENAKEGIIVWTCEDFTPGSLTVFAAGFSGETALVKVPGKKDDKGRDLTITLRKTREINYNDPGDLANRRDLALDKNTERWIMR